MTPVIKKATRISYLAAQASINGVYLRSPRFSVLATRRNSGKINIRWFERSGWVRRGIWSKPLLRGIAASVDLFVSGLEGLLEAAHVASESAPDSRPSSPSWAFWLIPLFSLIAGAALFAVAPGLLRMAAGDDQMNSLGDFEVRALETGMRLIAAVLCFAGLTLSSDIRRFLRYQGACNRALTAFESGADLTIESSQAVSRAHPYCAPSLVLISVPFAVVIFGLILPYPFFEGLSSLPLVDYAVSVFFRLLLLPVIAAMAHEVLRTGFLARIQGGITREPTPDELEVALAGFRQLLKLEKDPMHEGEDELEISSLNELGGPRVPPEHFRES